jgi:molecular chaperone GrpE
VNDEDVQESGVCPDDDGSAAAAEAPPSPEQAEIAALSAQIDGLKDEVLRARAEMENVRKRAERDVEAAHKYGQERFVHDLIPVKDSIDLGLDAAEHATDIASLRQGMELTAKAFADFFDKLAVSVIEPHGQPFDPEHHQAMTMEESAEHPPGTVIRVMQKGYKLNERLLRPALVVVAKTGGS